MDIILIPYFDIDPSSKRGTVGPGGATGVIDAHCPLVARGGDEPDLIQIFSAVLRTHGDQTAVIPFVGIVGIQSALAGGGKGEGHIVQPDAGLILADPVELTAVELDRGIVIGGHRDPVSTIAVAAPRVHGDEDLAGISLPGLGDTIVADGHHTAGKVRLGDEGDVRYPLLAHTGIHIEGLRCGHARTRLCFRTIFVVQRALGRVYVQPHDPI